MDFNPCDYERFYSRRDICKLTLVCTAHQVARCYQVIFSDLILDRDLQIWKGSEIGGHELLRCFMATTKFCGINLIDNVEVSSVPHFFNDTASEHLVGFLGHFDLLLSRFILVRRPTTCATYRVAP